MDPRRFDALVRSLVVSASRRRVLAGLLPALLPALGALQPGEATAAKRRAAKRKRRAQRKKQNKKQQQAKRRKQARAEVLPAGCCKSGNCTAGTGKNLTKCCFENQKLAGKTFKGSNLTKANFTGATLTKAKFQQTNLTGACFVDATITGANFKQANLSGVVFCRTTINSAGDTDDSGCHLGSLCCPTCDQQHPCPGDQLCCEGRCQTIECCTNAECGNDQACCDGTCQAATGWVPQGSFGTAGGGNAAFNNPWGVAVSPDTLTVWVADTFNHRISVWTRPNASSTNWRPAARFGIAGDGDAELDNPFGVAVSPDTLTVWTADGFNHRISVWTRPNASSTDWDHQVNFGTEGPGDAQLSFPAGVAVSPDTLTVWVVDQGNDRISIWSRTDADSTDWAPVPNGHFGTLGPGDAEFHDPWGVAVSPDTLTVWVADFNNHRISVWTRPNASSTDWDHQVNVGTPRPSGVAVSPDTLTVWVSDFDNDRISIWSRTDADSTDWAPVPNGHFGTDGDGDAEFDRPSGVAVAPDMRTVWVTDRDNDRVSVWGLGCPAS